MTVRSLRAFCLETERKKRMARIWILVGLVVAAAASAATYQRGSHWKEYRYPGTRLMADLGTPDAVIRTASLAKLPRDLLKAPIAREVLTEDLAFYYEHNEDRLGFDGALRRIAYEHRLGWSDRIVAATLDAPAEVALWRDGKGALRHFAIVMHRNSLARLLHEAGTIALKDRQLKKAGEIDMPGGKALVLALELNPRRTFLLVASGERVALLSDPGLLFNEGGAMAPEARAAIAAWLEADGVLARRFALDPVKPATHTLAVGAPTLALGYGVFLPAFKALRFDYDTTWSTSLWVDRTGKAAAGWGDAALWRAAPANPSACVALPVDWSAARRIVAQAQPQPEIDASVALKALDGSALACWYGSSSLYAPVFIARISPGLPNRDAVVGALAQWAGVSTFAARGPYVVFSPDEALVALVADTIARKNPSVADQMPAGASTLALLTPRPLSAMAEKEALEALSGPGDANLRAAAQAHLPARMKALAAYPPYRLELADPGNARAGWMRVEWRTPEERK
jgi:uncharacterized protein YfaA (DUF2138 family)